MYGSSSVPSWCKLEKMSGARGVAWRREEVLDLLDLWGDSKTQAALRESHRNKDVYDEVSRGMVERGHQRSGDECRTKTKAMRQAYKRVLAHNSKSGNSPTTCPFFDQLESILRGDPSVKRRRISQSIPRNTPTSTVSQPPVFTLELRAVTAEEELDALNVEQASNQGLEGNIEQHAEASLAVHAMENNQGELLVGRCEGNAGEDAPREEDTEEERGRGTDQNNRNLDQIPPDAALSDLSPSSRITLRETRRKKATSINKVGEMLIRQSMREHKSLIEASTKDSDKLVNVLQSSQEREDNLNQAVLALFKDTLGCISEMSRSIAHSKDEGDKHSGHSTARNSDASTESTVPERFCSSLSRGMRDITEESVCCSQECGHSDMPFAQHCTLQQRPQKVRAHYQDAFHNCSTTYHRTLPQNQKSQTSGRNQGAKQVIPKCTSQSKDCTSMASEFGDLEVLSQETYTQVSSEDDEDSPSYVGTHVWGETQHEQGVRVVPYETISKTAVASIKRNSVMTVPLKEVISQKEKVCGKKTNKSHNIAKEKMECFEDAQNSESLLKAVTVEGRVDTFEGNFDHTTEHHGSSDVDNVESEDCSSPQTRKQRKVVGIVPGKHTSVISAQNPSKCTKPSCGHSCALPKSKGRQCQGPADTHSNTNDSCVDVGRVRRNIKKRIIFSP